jgi:hypothetical protein
MDATCNACGTACNVSATTPAVKPADPQQWLSPTAFQIMEMNTLSEMKRYAKAA